MNKILAKQIFAQAGLPLAAQMVMTQSDNITYGISAIHARLGSYVVVKPSGQGSALGITLVENAHQLEAALKTAFALDRQILIEERIDGKEITVGVIDTDEGPKALPVIEITTPKDSWYDYAHRYTAGLFEHIIPAALTDAQTARLQRIAIDAHISLGCRDLSRADFVVPNAAGEYLLEVNTMPGMTPCSLYPDGARAYGLDFPSLVSYLAERAYLRKHRPYR